MKQNPESAKKISQEANKILELIPKWIAKNYPNSDPNQYQLLQGGDLTLNILINKTHIIKVFVHKWEGDKNDWFQDMLLGNYQVLFKNPEIETKKIGLLKIINQDDILNKPVVISKYIPKSRSLSDLFYTFSNQVQNNLWLDVSNNLRTFHIPINGSFNTQVILDKFDFAIKNKNIDKRYKNTFQKIRNNTSAKLIEKNLFLTHGDLHYSNILITEDGRLHFIDFDFAMVAPKFKELAKIFLNCSFPNLVVTDSMRENYPEARPDCWELWKINYPELWDPNFENEIKLSIASQIIARFQSQIYQKQAKIAFEYFF